ncbi:hypothetical protein AWZ03_011426 [Drosophila navojoa]|uniref:Uncharacterized protein n=1 Tax=Drosophila navojoa TaxID=7232 RepID=A0A484B0A4_DRONA|nr:hypothetical protein AWZ03_011426 [Drosophila navojoa]
MGLNKKRQKLRPCRRLEAKAPAAIQNGSLIYLRAQLMLTSRPKPAQAAQLAHPATVGVTGSTQSAISSGISEYMKQTQLTQLGLWQWQQEQEQEHEQELKQEQRHWKWRHQLEND